MAVSRRQIGFSRWFSGYVELFRRPHSEEDDENTRREFSSIFLVLILAFLLGFLILENGEALRDQLVFGLHAAALDDPVQARREVSPWIRDFDTIARAVCDLHEENLPVIMSGGKPWIVAYLLQPTPCFFDSHETRRRFHESGWIWVSGEKRDFGLVEIMKASATRNLLQEGFEDGTVSAWSTSVIGTDSR